MDQEFLGTPLPPDIADLSPGQAAALASAARAAGFSVFQLDGARMNTKPELMDHAAAALSFPGDFGRNWDAMIDYLGDMATVHKNTKILILVNNAAEMRAAAPKLYDELRRVCGLACNNAREWSRNSVILKFVFVSK